MSRYHGNSEGCPWCGTTYGAFRTGLKYKDVFQWLWSISPDPADWRYKRRRTILGRWHSFKKEMWEAHKVACEEAAMQVGSEREAATFLIVDEMAAVDGVPF